MPTPALVIVATRDLLPLGLNWTGTEPIPAPGARIKVRVNSLGLGTVRGFFALDNYLGLAVELDQLPQWFIQAYPGQTLVYAYGREVANPTSTNAR